MLKALKGLAGGREANGALSGKQLSVGSRTVKVDKLLGEGGFATIYRCTDVETGDVLAIKHFLLTGYPDATRDADTEVSVMERLQGCPHVVRMHEASVAGPSGAPTAAFVLMDFCPNTLVAFLHQRAQPIDNVTLMHIFLPICRAVEAMHCLAPPLAHRDIKAENVLLGPEGRWMLCDFGSACGRHGVMESARDIALEEEVVRRYTTPAYRAPELYDLFAREYIGLPVDIWALGVLLYLLAFGRLPFEGEAKLQVLNGRYTMPEGRPEPLRALLRSMLTVSPRQRPDIHQVIARLVEMVPPDVAQHMPGMPVQSQPQPLQQQQQQQAQVPPAAGRIAGSPAPGWQHERAPSQGWAEFSDSPSALPAASVGSSDSAAAFQRHQSGSSGSWATFSPKKEDEAAAAAGMAAAATAGSFWSSFGDDPPSEGVGLLDQQAAQQKEPQPAVPPAPLLPPVPRLQPAGTAVTAASASAARSAPNAAPPQPHPPEPMPSAAAPQPGPPEPQAAEVSPLSAGLARMSLSHSFHGSNEVLTNPPAAAASGRAVPASVAEQQSPAGDGLAREMEALRQHCVVLEQLLDARNGEVRKLRELARQQAEELTQLRERLQQGGQQATSATVPTPATAAFATAGSGSSSGTPSSSRLGKDMRLQTPDSDGSGGGTWVSFSPSGPRGSGDAPTPTLQPAGGSTFRSDANLPAISKAPQAAAAVAVPAAEVPLRAKPGGGSGVPAGGATSSLGSSPGAEQLNGMLGKADSGELAPQLRSYPVALTPTASPLFVGAQSAPASARPSPARIGSSSQLPTHGSYSPKQPSSPMRGRPAPAVAPRQNTSPSKHRRHGTAPTSGFFEDLNPLG